jgi:hypothetical protein
MRLGEKLANLRTLEGFARGLGREMTQGEVAKAILRSRKEPSASPISPSSRSGRAGAHDRDDAPAPRAVFRSIGHLVDDLEDLLARRGRVRDARSTTGWISGSSKERRNSPMRRT